MNPSPEQPYLFFNYLSRNYLHPNLQIKDFKLCHSYTLSEIVEYRKHFNFYAVEKYVFLLDSEKSDGPVGFEQRNILYNYFTKLERSTETLAQVQFNKLHQAGHFSSRCRSLCGVHESFDVFKVLCSTPYARC